MQVELGCLDMQVSLNKFRRPGEASPWLTREMGFAGVPVWYTAVVPLPLALPDLVERLRNGYYRHLEALQHDASTIASNAQLYNGAGSDVANTATGKLPSCYWCNTGQRNIPCSCSAFLV